MINLTNNQVKALNLFTDFYIMSLKKNENVFIKVNPYDNVIHIIMDNYYGHRRYYIRKNRISCVSIRNHGIKKIRYDYKLKKR